MNTMLTIQKAVADFSLNKNTLMSWVKKEKIKAEKVTKGAKAYWSIDKVSLEQFLAERKQDQNSAKPVESLDTNKEKSKKPVESDSRSETGSGSQVILPKFKPETGNGAERPRKSPVVLAKNSMRSLTPAELCNVRQWIENRLDKGKQAAENH